MRRATTCDHGVLGKSKCSDCRLDKSRSANLLNKNPFSPVKVAEDLVDVEPHESSVLACGATLDGICGDLDDFAQRQLRSIRAGAGEWKEPPDYASVRLPSTDPRVAMVSARYKARLAAEHKFQELATCIAGHALALEDRAAGACRVCRRANQRARSVRPDVVFKNAARRAVRYAIARGEIVRQPCEVCGATSPTVHAHHDDYAAPLNVRWLCFTHHVRQHHNAFTTRRRVRASLMRKMYPRVRAREEKSTGKRRTA